MEDWTIQALYERYKKDVYTYLLGQTHHRPLAEDLTSEVFLSALQGLAVFRGESSIQTWLLSIARHKWYGHLRRQRREVDDAVLLEQYFSHGPELEQMLITRELAGRVQTLLAEESERDRDIVRLRVEGWPYSDIARKHQISESSARVIDFRTKSKLRSALRKEGYSDG